MFTIAVCDDDMQERMQEVQIVKNIFSQKELEAGIEEFQTGQHFLDVLHRVPYDIVLLDIQMGEVSGFTLAEELYKITGGENIIFVSSMENLVFESIHFRSFCQKITSGGRTYRGGRKLDTAEYKNGMSGV